MLNLYIFCGGMFMIKFAIVGATGLVGKKIIQVLMEQNMLEGNSLKLFASEESKNRKIKVNNKFFEVFPLVSEVLEEKFDIVFFSAGDDVSRIWAEKFVLNGAIVIDNSNAFRRNPKIPLVVPEINGELCFGESKLISNPNCSTIQLAIVLNRLLKLAKIEKVVVSTYQSVSGAGREALNDFFNGTNFSIPEGIKNNFISHIGAVGESGFCVEEEKIMFEISKILNTKINCVATAVRVPIPFCHGESVYVQFDRDIGLDEVLKVLSVKEIVVDKFDSLPSNISNTDETHVCRIRKAGKNEIAFFIVADNLRRGAATNAVLIAKNLLKI